VVTAITIIKTKTKVITKGVDKDLMIMEVIRITTIHLIKTIMDKYHKARAMSHQQPLQWRQHTLLKTTLIPITEEVP
jgi:hypothetical protein